MEPLLSSSSIFTQKKVYPHSKWHAFLSVMSSLNIFAADKREKEEKIERKARQAAEEKTRLEQEGIKREIEREMDLFIDLENSEMIEKFMKSGYSPNDSQRKKLLNKTSLWYIPDNSKSWHRYQVTPTPCKIILRDYFQKNSSFIEATIIANYQEIEDIFTKTTKSWRYGLSCSMDKEFSDKISDLVKEQKKLFTFDVFTKDAQTMRSALTLLHKISEMSLVHTDNNSLSQLREFHQEKLESLEKKYLGFGSHIEEKLEKTQLLYLSQSLHGYLQEKILNGTYLNASHMLLDRVPKNSKAILENIEQIIADIKVENLGAIEKLDFDTLRQKRIPQILEGYLGLSQDYKTKLKTADNKSPDDLLLDSLQEICSLLFNIHEKQQHMSFDNMNATHKYLKNKGYTDYRVEKYYKKSSF